MIVKLPTKQHLELLSLKGSCTGSSESTLVKIPYCGNHMLRLIVYVEVMNVEPSVTLTGRLYFLCILSLFEAKPQGHTIFIN